MGGGPGRGWTVATEGFKRPAMAWPCVADPSAPQAQDAQGPVAARPSGSLGRQPVGHVCIVTQALYPDILGGAPIGAHRLANALADLGVGVEVHTVDYRRPAEAAVQVERRYALTRHRFPRLPWDAIGTAGNPFAWRIRRAVARSTADVVHVRSHLFFPSLFGALGARASGKALVVSVHGVRAVRTKAINALQEAWIQSIGRMLFRMADRVVCLTGPDRAEVLRYGADPARTSVLWNAPDDVLFHPDPGQPVREVVWLGRHVEEKGLAYLVEAWAEVVRKAPGHALVLIGDGPLRAEREAQVARLGLQASVRFEPFQDQGAVAARLRRCELFVLPSLKEGFPISLVEAMACGKPVVTTTGLEEIVAGGGAVVPPRDPRALAAALLSFLLDPARAAAAGDEAARRAKAEYGMDRLALAYLAVYGQALRDRKERQKGADPSA
jgi:glycosyltransferase involved in cell wall biosynthesis